MIRALRTHRKLDAGQVADIKRLLLDGGVTIAEIATRYGVTAPNIRLIRNGETWWWVRPAETAAQP